MRDGVCADVPAEVEEFAYSIPCHAAMKVVALGIEPAGVDEEILGEAVPIKDLVDTVAHRFLGMIKVERDWMLGEVLILIPPGVEIVIVDGGEAYVARDADELIEVIGGEREFGFAVVLRKPVAHGDAGHGVFCRKIDGLR